MNLDLTLSLFEVVLDPALFQLFCHFMCNFAPFSSESSDNINRNL